MKNLIKNLKLNRKLEIAAKEYLLNQIKFHDKTNNSELVEVAAELLKGVNRK